MTRRKGPPQRSRGARPEGEEQRTMAIELDSKTIATTATATSRIGTIGTSSSRPMAALESIERTDRHWDVLSLREEFSAIMSISPTRGPSFRPFRGSPCATADPQASRRAPSLTSRLTSGFGIYSLIKIYSRSRAGGRRRAGKCQDLAIMRSNGSGHDGCGDGDQVTMFHHQGKGRRVHRWPKRGEA